MSLLETAFKVIAPHRCYVCKSEGALLCPTCSQNYFATLPPRCYHCRQPNTDSRICEFCHAFTPLSHLWVRTNYSDWAKQLIHDFKFARAQAAAEVLASVMVDALPQLDRRTYIMPVPTATSRARLRGYDQAALLARNIAYAIDRPYAPLLQRLGQSRQVGANRETRIEQLVSAYRLTRSRLVVGASILLVDDILTTGSSLESAARVLKAAGAKSVNAVVFAQKI